MKEKTPDQIRRETVPVKQEGLIYGILAGMLGFGLWFCGWALFHQQQVLRYPSYAVCALRTKTAGMSFFGRRAPKRSGLTGEQLRYALLRYGNEDHHLDSEIIRHGWYPKGSNSAEWVYMNGAVPAIYSDAPAMVFKWPFLFSMLTLLGTVISGLVVDYRYRAAVVAGIPFEGSVVATVRQYTKETKGDGMKYRVKEWKDR